MTPTEARLQLLAQHEWLRTMLLQTQALARRRLAGTTVAGTFDAVVRALGDAFAQHNAYERWLLEPILRDADTLGPLRVARMLDEHRAAHAALGLLAIGTERDVALRFDDLAELLDAHLAAEERTFLNAQVLHDDLPANGRPRTEVPIRSPGVRVSGA